MKNIETFDDMQLNDNLLRGILAYGFENPSTGLPLENREEIDMTTPYGKPSEVIVCGTFTQALIQ